MLFFYQKHETLKISPGQLNHPSLSKRSTGCTRQDLGREHSILLSVNHMLYVNQVCHGVSRYVEDGSCSSSRMSESQWTVLTGYLTVSTNVRRYQTLHRWQLFFQEDSALVHCACNTVQLLQRSRLAFEWKMRFSCFPILPGSAEAQVIWGGILKHLLIAYFIGNISAKKY